MLLHKQNTLAEIIQHLLH